MYTIVILVLFTKVKFISSLRNANETTTVHDGIARSLGIWPLRYKQESMVVSTFPLRLALNKLAAAAEGEAKVELLTALGITEPKALTKFYPQLDTKIQCLRESDLIMLNKIYVNHSDAVAPSFFADSFKNFGALVEKVPFLNPYGLVSFVNQWVDSTTFKRITNLLSIEDVHPRFNMILVNALHMKPTWENTFDVRLTVMTPFHLHNKTETVEMRMMTALEKEFYYYKDHKHKFQVLMVHLACDGCKITFFLPYEVSGLPKLIKLLADYPDVMNNAVKKLDLEPLNVRLPVFKIKTVMNWNPYLKGMGIKKIFDYDSSGLDSMSLNRDRNHFLGKAIQKVFIELDEFGVYRTSPRSRLSQPEFGDRHMIQQFLADHPFYFRVDIQDSDTSHELLSGVFYGPD